MMSATENLPTAKENDSTGPLTTLRVVEFAGIGPAPHASILLSDLGAEVVRVQRPGSLQSGQADPMARGRSALVELDLKSENGRDAALRLISQADVLIEGFRPGVMESLRLGPQETQAVNPRLIYSRMTGWGQTGPWSSRAGHDINYISVTGVLNAIGHANEPPVPPINYVGDYGGGSMFLLLGILSGLFERERSGAGQVVDAGMVDGVVALSHLTWVSRRREAGAGWIDHRESNVLDGGAPFYCCYETSDGLYMAVGAIEPQFYAQLLNGLDIDPAGLPAQFDRQQWSATKERFARIFKERTREEWTAIFSAPQRRDACVTPVLSFAEAPENEQLRARGSFAMLDGTVQHSTAPHFSRSVPAPPKSGPTLLADPAGLWGGQSADS